MTWNRTHGVDVQAHMGLPRALLVMGVLVGATSVGCETADDVAPSGGEGALVIELVLDSSTEFADYADGYELFADVSGPVDASFVGSPTSTRTVLVERSVPAGRYRARAGLLPCETDEDPCGPERDACEIDVDVVDGARLVLTVDYQPGRLCVIAPSSAP